MATWNTPVYTSQGTVPPAGVSDAVNMPLAKKVGGKLRLAPIKYIWNGNEAASDVINLVVTKAGALILPQDSKVFAYANAANANLVVNIGDASSAIRYSNGLTVFANTAANGVLQPSLWTNCASPLLTQLFNPVDIPVPSGSQINNLANDQTILQVKIVSTSNVAANSVIVFEVGFQDE
jgi:hypothetical protein